MAETEGRIGLVVFSDTAYEMLPPDTRSEELRPILRFFEAPPGGFRRPGLRASPLRPSVRTAAERGEPLVALVPRRHEDLDGPRRGAGDRPAGGRPVALGPAPERPRQLRLRLLGAPGGGHRVRARRARRCASSRSSRRRRIGTSSSASSARTRCSIARSSSGTRASGRASPSSGRRRGRLPFSVPAFSASSPSTSGSARGSRGGGPRERVARVAPAGRGRGCCGCARRGGRGARGARGGRPPLGSDDARRRHRVRRARRRRRGSRTPLLPAGITRTALGLEDDVEFRGAVDQFWKSEPRAPLQVFTDVTRRTAAERRLARLIETEERAERRSALATLRGAFLLEEARNSPVQRHVFLRRAIEQFRRAAELDPGNADAVYDLELALKLLRETGGGTAGGGDRRAPLPSPGSGSSSSGSGF